MRFSRSCAPSLLLLVSCGGEAPVAVVAPPALSAPAPVTMLPAPEIARYVQDWQVVCVAGPEAKSGTNACELLTLTRVSDDAFFFAGGYYGSAHIGTHALKKQAFRSAFLGVVDRAGAVKWVKNLGVSWHNEISSSVTLDAHHVMISGLHGAGFHPSLPSRAIRPMTHNGVPQDMGFKAEEQFVGVVTDEGKLEWVKNTLDLLKAPWDEDQGSPSCVLESDGAGGASCSSEWQKARYRIHLDAKGMSQVTPDGAVPAEPPRPPFPAAPPGRTLVRAAGQTVAPLGTWNLIEDHRKWDGSGSVEASWALDVHHLLWHVGPAGTTWNAPLGDGPARGSAGLLVAKDGVAWATAPHLRTLPGQPPFAEVSLVRVEPDGRVTWSSPLWGLSVPASPANRVDTNISAVDESGNLVLRLAYSVPLAIANIPLPSPRPQRPRYATVAVSSQSGAIKRLEWMESPAGCLRDLTFGGGDRSTQTLALSATERIVAGPAYGDWDTASCGAATGGASVVMKVTRAP